MKSLLLIWISTSILINTLYAQPKEFKEYYPNGVLKASGYKNNEGKEVGKYRYFNEKGTLMIETHFTNGKPDGDIKRYDASGNTIITGKYTNGVEDGKWISYGPLSGYEKDKKFIELDVEMGKITAFTKYYPNGKIWAHSKLASNNLTITKALFYPQIELLKQKNGKYETFYESGQLKHNGNFINGIETGASVSFYETGERYEVIEHNSKGEPVESTTYHENGKIQSKTYFLNGKSHGEYIAYFAYGPISAKGKYVNGNKDGYWLEAKGEGRYVNGKKEGFWKEYSDSRKESETLAVSQGYYKNGKKEGQWKEFNSVAYVMEQWAIETGTYKNGVRTGLWKFTTPKGSLIKTQQY